MSGGDTIFAPASGRGRAGVAVMRVSGPAAVAAAEALGGTAPEARRASLRRLRESGGAPIDHALVLLFPGPNSFTGEDVVEFQTHGAPAVTRALARRLAALPGLRPAAPGEFARRAFLNGRLDLAAAEGLADLIDAETDAQRRFALRQVDGGARAQCALWMESLSTSRAALEATLDFADEGDVDADAVIRDGLARAARIADAQRAAIAAGARAERIRDGFVVALVGRPNAGKSRLMNALVGRDVAIVSETPGATRDVIEALLEIDGWPIRLLDLAGLRAAEEAVEAEGVRRAAAAAASADLRLILVDGVAGGPPGDDLAPYRAQSSLLLWTKADVPGFRGPPPDALALSAETGVGLDALRAALADAAHAALETGEDAVFAHERQRAALSDCVAAIDAACAAPAPELAAESLRVAADALGRVVGRVDVEQVLDLVFGRFCIGK